MATATSGGGHGLTLNVSPVGNMMRSHGVCVAAAKELRRNLHSLVPTFYCKHNYHLEVRNETENLRKDAEGVIFQSCI